MTSAYPVSDDVLTARVRDLATELGAWPSQRRVMRTCRVGAPRADAALAAVKRSGFDPARPARPLALVRASGPDGTDPGAADAGDGAASETDSGAPGAGAPGTTPAAAAAPASGGEIVGDHSNRPAEMVTNGQVTRAAETPPATPPETPAVTPAGAPAGTSVAASVVVPAGRRGVRVPRWPILITALGAFVSIWGGWVGLGELSGFGPVRLLPGIWDEFVINSAITLPLGMEAYAFYALWVWLAPATAQVSKRARRFACWSAIAALGLGLFGQATYHLLITSGAVRAPNEVVVFVSCLPVLVLGAGAALAHLTHHTGDTR